MYKQLMRELRSNGLSVITGIYSVADADRTRAYIRLAEARLAQPLSVLWLGTLEDSGDRVRGRVVGKNGCKAVIEVVR